MNRELNHYECAVQAYWQQQKVPYAAVDQIRRLCLPLGNVKNFDFLLYPDSDCPVLVELKGRTFHGSTLTGKPAFDCWVTLEDVLSLKYWQEVFRIEKPACRAGFVFGFQFERIDVDPDGQGVFDCDGRRYVFYWIELTDYSMHMTQRSAKWKTVCLTADQFCRLSHRLEDLFAGIELKRMPGESINQQ